jgi:hypothetical protein
MTTTKTSVLRTAIVCALAGALSACTPGRIDYRFVESAYDAQQDHWAPYSRALTADVSGNPFAVPQDEFNTVVNEAIQAQGIAPSATSPYRLRMIFNGPRTNSNYICQNKGDHGSKLGQSLGGTITVAAAYCRGTDGMTFLEGSVSDVTGPSDPRLKEFLRMVTTQLFPLPESDQGQNCMIAAC